MVEGAVAAGKNEIFQQGNALLYSLYRTAGAFIHPLLRLAAPVLNFIVPGWRLEQRFGDYPKIDRTNQNVLIWIHAASVGEVQAARALIAVLGDSMAGSKIFLTTMTRQGREVALSQLPAHVRCELAPLDTPRAVKKALRTLRPDVYICLETELWPVMLTEARKAGIPMLLLNGRMSERSFNQYQRIRGTMNSLLRGFAAVGVIKKQDGERYRRLGVDAERIEVCGNMKYDLKSAEPDPVQKRYKQLLNIDRQTVFICGSTRRGEEKLLLPVYKRLRDEADADLLWIIAPRHLHRLPEIRTLLDRADLEYDLFSHCAAKGRHRDIVLLDSMGELADLYSVGDYNFCGGGLLDKGGHNIMEPIRWRKPVFFGPFMQDFQDAVDLVLSAGAGFQVNNSDELADCLIEHQPDSPAYQQACSAAVRLVQAQQGAVSRQADMVFQQIRGRGLS
jgi:3-deoxy-D-manno-octulosonic-acid transferase